MCYVPVMIYKSAMHTIDVTETERLRLLCFVQHGAPLLKVFSRLFWTMSMRYADSPRDKEIGNSAVRTNIIIFIDIFIADKPKFWIALSFSCDITSTKRNCTYRRKRNKEFRMRTINSDRDSSCLSPWRQKVQKDGTDDGWTQSLRPCFTWHNQ